MREQLAQQPPAAPSKRRASVRPPAPANPHHAGFHAGIHPEDLPEQTGPFGSSYQVDTEQDDDEGQEQDVGDASYYLFVLCEEQLPPPPDYGGLAIALLCSLVLVSLLGLLLFWPKSEPTVSFSTTITGFRLPAVQASLSLVISATGKGHTNAIQASGKITFYNGQTYTQIIPTGTILKSRDGVSVITEQPATRTRDASTTSAASRAIIGTTSNWTRFVPNATNARKNRVGISISRVSTSVSLSKSDANNKTVCTKPLISSRTDWLKRLW